MSRVRIIVRVCLVVVVAVVLLVPAAREELAWHWAKFQDRAPSYLAYSTAWPKGRHAGEAKMRYEERQRGASKRDLILQAYQQTSNTNAASDADSAYRKDRQSRLETLFWRHATNAHTAASYNDYLQQYPAGQFAAQARAQIESLNHSAHGAEAAPTPPPP